MTAAPLPGPAIDADSAPFWEGLRAHKLLVQQCSSCGRLRFPPRAICANCHSRESRWSTASGHGRVLSWITTHEIAHPAFRDQLPYITLCVELVEQAGLTMYGNLQRSREQVEPAAPVVHRLPVQAAFEDTADGFTLLQWIPEP